jgi:hypothetical protein
MGALEVDALEAFDGARWVPFHDKPDGELRLGRDQDRDSPPATDRSG